MKAWLWRYKDVLLSEMLDDDKTCDPISLLWEAVFAVMTPENIEGWYRDSGYVQWLKKLSTCFALLQT